MAKVGGVGGRLDNHGGICGTFGGLALASTRWHYDHSTTDVLTSLLGPYLRYINPSYLPEDVHRARFFSRTLFAIMNTQMNTLQNGELKNITGRANADRLDTDLSCQVIGATGPNAHPRLASIIPNLIKHLHAFMRESEITSHELMSAFDLVGSTQGHASTTQSLIFFNIVSLGWQNDR